MTVLTFESPYWNLAQAAVWVRFRSAALVDRFAAADPDAYKAIGFYPSMEPETAEEVSSVLELERALETGDIRSRGYHKDNAQRPEDIRPEQWAYLSLRPPFAFDQRAPQLKLEIWENITVLSAEMKKRWRGENEISSRTKYNWGKIREIYFDIKSKLPKASQNEIISEAQLEYEARHGEGTAPSRPSFQNHIKRWK